MQCPETPISGKVQNVIKHPRFRFAVLMAIAVSATFLWAVVTNADERPADSDATQSVWIISTRQAPMCNRACIAQATLDYWQLCEDKSGNRQWLESTKEEFHAADSIEGPTCFHIHGNRTGHCSAINEGNCVLKALRSQAAGRKFRFVIWSWPSSKIQGSNRQDVRVKAARSDVQAYYLARCLGRMNPQARVGMVGYSFGARIITGALEMLAGGQVAGCGLHMADNNDNADSSESTSETLPEIRIILVAAATDCHWLLPGRRTGLALDLADWALITKNCCDPVLRWYPKMYGCHGPQATGYVGPALTCEQRQKVEVLNLSCSVGKSHSWQNYLQSPCLYWRLGECVFYTADSPAGDEN